MNTTLFLLGVLILVMCVLVLWLLNVKNTLNQKIDKLQNQLNSRDWLSRDFDSRLGNVEGVAMRQVERITALYQALGYEFRVISTKQTAIAEKVSK